MIISSQISQIVSVIKKGTLSTFFNANQLFTSLISQTAFTVINKKKAAVKSDKLGKNKTEK